MKREVRKRLLEEAEEAFVPFGINFDHFKRPELYVDLTAEVQWVHRHAKGRLVLTEIHFDPETGEILQCGTQGGDLTL